jgi:hypothetical protein
MSGSVTRYRPKVFRSVLAVAGNEAVHVGERNALGRLTTAPNENRLHVVRQKVWRFEDEVVIWIVYFVHGSV